MGLVFYGRYASPFVRRVAVSLRLYGIDYRHALACRYAPIATGFRIATE
jgi:glutathione S-transferase